MAKTEETIKLENAIWKATAKQGVFGCFEVTIGWFGDERVDYMTYDTKGIWRCFEIKVSKSDFYSKAKKTFIGHFNYFVLPSKELYEDVKDDIPKHIGVYICGGYSKKTKKQVLQVDEQVLKNSLIRSLSRETTKLYKSENPRVMEQHNRRVKRLEDDARRYREELQKMHSLLYLKFGRNWQDVIGM